MCGIAVTWESADRCAQMLRKMEHRGLPGEEYHRVLNTPGCPYLGHVRLPIIDITVKQNQPMFDDKIAMVFSGEIYNYLELDPAAINDTEVLFNLLRHDGPNALNAVDGMYSIVYYDFRTHQLHVLTDHLSKKPLYMDLRTNEIASEIKALNPAKYDLNRRFWNNVARFGYNPNHETAFQNIIQIPPNTHLTIDIDGAKNWDYGYINMEPLDKPTAYDAMRIIVDAVRNRLVSDVPIGFLLSGGLDSSIVCYIAKMLVNENLNVFHIDNDEATYARMMSNKLDASLISLDINPIYAIEDIMYYNESPVDLGSVVPQYLLCEAIKNEGYRVAITGDGADELFGGYTRMCKYIDPVADTQYHDVYLELPYYHCPRLDKMSMCHTVELRSPFLSKNVIRLATALNYGDRIGKNYLKSLFRYTLPDEIINRPKVPLRINEMKVDREQFKFERMSYFKNLIMRGRYSK